MSRYYKVSCLSLFTTVLTMADEAVDYSRDVLPILSENCFECHGPDENTREAGRRLDTADGA
ncbi:MAG: c-type cytochrome domain-containing protein, partial [Verrucomicrobiota bacterium]|nr:c-type cytochrome domain-containing protein [Verrucomicrobiota bacterium]